MPNPTDTEAGRPPQLDAARPEPYSLADLLAIMAALRNPVTGCPWDLEQTFRTIAPYTIEEAYEVADAIARGDMDDLRDELGDLLLQVVYHARMAEEDGSFAFAEVVDAISRKMVRRHPHVFGDAATRAGTQLQGLWERVKAEEAATKKARDGGGIGGGQSAGLHADGRDRNEPPASVLDAVPVGLPALTRAVKLQAKAARVGFDWPSLAPVLAKLKEEIAELEAEIAAGDADAAAEEYGDVLFVLANVARHLKLDPEGALRAANAKFARRFRHVERRLAEDGRPHTEVSLAEMDAWWDEAKAMERRG
jgi:ATP diphosphatase